MSGVLADFGYVTLRLSDDWQGADFIAHHVSGDWFLEVQLKSRLTVDAKYRNQDIWICFPYYEDTWYLYHHDAFLSWAYERLDIGETDSWNLKGLYHWRSLSKELLSYLGEYALTNHPNESSQESAANN